MYHFTVEADRRLVVVSFSGEFTDTDPHAYIAEMLACVPYGAGWRTLADMTAVERVHLTPEGVRTALAATRSDPRFQNASIAYVVSASSPLLELATMFQTLADGEGFHVGVFTDRAAAMDWLFR